MKKFLIFFLAVSLLLASTACSDNSAEETKETAAAVENTSPEISAEEVPEEEEEILYADLVPVNDYDGWTLNIANDGYSAAYFSIFTVDELTGDAFTDSIYNRNVRVMEKYNINIEENNTGATSLLKNSVTAGTHDFAFGYVLLESCMGLIMQDYVKPISDLPTIDLTKPYWDKGSQDALSFNGDLYYGHCDISFDHYEGMAMLFYNGELLSDNGITDTPYELQSAGQWTLDRMYDMMMTVVRDENGDGKMDLNNDTFGWAGRDFECLPSLYASNLHLLELHEGKDPPYTFHVADEAVMAVGDMLNKIVYDKNVAHVEAYGRSLELFKQGDVLFYSSLLGDFKNMRDKEDDYGIIAYPSLEENTDPRIYIQNTYTILIPSDCEDDSRLGNLIEALAADTYDTVLDVYIEKAVIGKGARDQESAALLRNYITKRDYDLFYAFGIRDQLSAYTQGLQNGTYASQMQRRQKGMTKVLEKSLVKLGYME